MNRETELLEALSCGDGGISVAVDYAMVERGDHLKLPSCTIELGYHPYLKHVSETVFETAFNLANQLLSCPSIPPKVCIALEAFQRRTETLRP